MKSFHEIDHKNCTDKYIVAIDPGWNKPAIYVKNREFEEGNDTGYDLYEYNIETEAEAIKKCKKLNSKK